MFKLSIRKRRNLYCLLCLIILVEFGIVPVLSPLGFKCSDPKLSYKYKGDTITPRTLISVTLITPLFILITTEWWGGRKSGKRNWWKQSLIWYQDFLSGFLVLVTITVVIKGLVGEPRPHFLDTCRPKEANNCTNQFISKFQCANPNISSYRIQDASKSFPSGHAALSFYFFVYLAWFFQKRLEDIRTSVIIWLQSTLLTWAVICSITRLIDHRHHWWDVLAGIFMGIFVAVCSIKSFSFGFKVNENEIMNNDSYEENSTGSVVFVSQEETSDTSMKWLISNIDHPPS